MSPPCPKQEFTFLIPLPLPGTGTGACTTVWLYLGLCSWITFSWCQDTKGSGEAPWICSEVLLILPYRAGWAWNTHQHRHHLVESCKSRGSSTSTSTHPTLSTPLVVWSALHHWEKPESMGNTGQGAQVAAGYVTQTWWLRPTAMGFARARERDCSASSAWHYKVIYFPK